MKIAIVGVGGVGGYYGALLARAGHEVTFVARGEQFKALKERGLSIKSVDDEFDLPAINVVESISKLSAPYLVLVATKTYDRDEVARQLAQITTDASIVIPLLNGIDNDIQIRKFVKKGRVYPGLTYIISTRTAPGRIEQTAGARTVFFGDRENPANPELRQLEKVMRDARIVATASSEIEKELWVKFLWITTFSGMTAVARCSIGQIVNDAEAFELYLQCLDEGIAVATAMGVQLDRSVRLKLIEKSTAFGVTGPDAKPSLLVDIENQRETEIEALHGTLVRFGKEHAVATPLHALIYAAVRVASKNYLLQRK